MSPRNDGDALAKAISLASEQTMGALEVREALTKIQRHLIARLPRIVAKLVEKAEDGDLMAIKLILDRFIPTRKAVERIEGESIYWWDTNHRSRYYDHQQRRCIGG